MDERIPFSFARAAESVQEHYGFEIGVSAVRDAAFWRTRREHGTSLEEQYAQ